MADLVVTRWRKYGKDRLYVNLVDSDRRVGWLDLQTGEVTIERPELAANFAAAVEEYRSANRLTLAAAAPPSTAPSAPQLHADAAVVHVERWRKFGRDRLYVTAVDGNRLGWADVRTGLITLDRPAAAAIVRD